MYKMKADGVVFYDPASDDMTLQALSPKAKYELNGAGSLEFTLLPGNVMYDGLNKLKTVITLEQDDEVIFRGRVLETTTDVYNQKEVYCEGELAFLLDSLVRPYEFKGKASDLFKQLVTKHNEQVEDYKRFEVGIITAVDDEDDAEVDGSAYADTLSEIKNLLVAEFGGYLRVRHENGVRYLDYVGAFGQTCSQVIEFGVNVVDIENKVNAQDVCTVLVPLGKDDLTIAKVNGGNDYIEDAEGIAQYGRIVKTHTWDDVTNPAALLTLGQEYMQKMQAETTLTFTAVDLHACGADVDGIHLGDTVKLLSLPHGIDKEDVCAEIELDCENPEKSTYTFGLPMESLTAGTANALKSLSSSINDQHRWLTETDKALNINVEAINLIGHRTTQLEIDVDAAEAAIALKASQDSVDILGDKQTAVEGRLDAAEAAILLKADLTVTDGLNSRLSTAEADINAAEAAIKLKASQTTVDEQGKRISTAEADIDAAEAAILLKASKDDLEAVSLRLDGAERSILLKADAVRVTALETEITGLLKVANLQAAIADLSDVAVTDLSVSGTAHCTTLLVHGSGTVDGYLDVVALEIGGTEVEAGMLKMGTLVSANIWGDDVDISHSHKVTVNDDGTITLGEVATTGGSFRVADTAYYKNGVSAARTAGKSDYISDLAIWGLRGSETEFNICAGSGTNRYADKSQTGKLSLIASSKLVKASIGDVQVGTISCQDVYDAGYSAAKPTYCKTDGLGYISATDSVSGTIDLYNASGYIATISLTYKL